MKANFGESHPNSDSKLADNTSQIKPKSAQKISNRLKLACSQAGGVDETAKKSGIKRRTLGNWLHGRGQPRSDDLVALSAATGVTIEWLATGHEPMLRSDLPAQIVRDTEDLRAQRIRTMATAAALGGVPVRGLAECGLKGWYQAGEMAVHAARPGDLTDAAAFAVMAIGDSMIPAGIKPGFLCFCSLIAQPDPGDAVFIERREGGRVVASIKRFRKIEEEWITLEGWQPSKNGHQDIYTEKIKSTAIKLIAPVVYIKTKL